MALHISDRALSAVRVLLGHLDGGPVPNSGIATGTPPSRPVAWWWTPNGNPQNAPRVVTAQTWFAARALARAEAARLLNLSDCDVSVWMKEAK